MDMHAARRWLNELIERRPLVVALLFNLAIFAPVYGRYTPYFMTNDDVAMMLYAAGVSKVAAASEMLLFTHVALGWCLKWLYSLDPTLPWYGLYLIACLFLAHTAILYATLKRTGDPRVLGFFLLYYALFGARILLGLQFTVVASFLAYGGLTLLLAEASDMGCSMRLV
jgi:hypothetical protein